MVPKYSDLGAISFEAPVGTAQTDRGTQIFSISNNLTSTIFALLNGVNYGYTELGPRFLHDAQDIYDIHKKDLPNTSFVKNKKDKKQVQTHDNVINLQHYKFWSQDK